MATSSPRVGFGLIPGDPFWVQVREAVKQRADELGVELVPLSAPATLSSDDRHLRFLEDLKVQELGALILHILPESLMLAILNDGFPIICAEDMSLRHPLLVSVQGLERAAVMAAEFVAARLAGHGHILIVGGLGDKTPTARVRVQGFYSVLAEHPGIRFRHLDAAWRYNETYEQLLEDADAWMADFDKVHIDAILGLSDPIALAARDVGRRLGIVDDRTLVVGINGDPLAIAAIEAGTMYATVEANPQDLGFRLAEFAQHAAQHEPLPTHFDYLLELVTGANVAAVAARKLLAIADLPSRLVDLNRKSEQQRLVQLEASLALNQQVGSILDQQELLRTMAEIISTHYHYDHVQFYLWSHGERTFVLAQRNPGGAEDVTIALATSGALGSALLNNQAVYIPDTRNSKRYAPDPRWPHIQSRVVLPVHVGGRSLGVLDLHSRQRTLRNQAELDALQTLADELGTAMRNAQLYSQVVQARAEAVHSALVRSQQLAGVSRQLRTSLDIILGYFRTAVAMPNPSRGALPPELVEDLHQAERYGGDLRLLIDSLLDLAQAETGVLQLQLEQIDTCSFLEEVFAAAMRIFAAGGDVRWRLQAPLHLPAIVADPVRLRTVLLNLLENATKFTARGHILLGADDVDGYVQFRVEDTGCGMAPEMVARVRQNLVLGAAARDPGLGLTIVGQLVKRHGGELEIESEPGRGTTFLVRLSSESLRSNASNGGPRAQLEQGVRAAHNERLLDSLVAKTRAYVGNNFATPFTRDQIAGALGVSPAYVSRVFHRQTGMALWDYVNGFRVARACDLLEHSELTVTEIAFAVGFNDPAYFSRVFRRETGKSPANYRRPGK